MSQARKWIRRAVSWGGKLIGVTIILSPAISGFKDGGTDIVAGAEKAAFNYSGYALWDGGFDQNQTIKGITTILVGLGIAWGFGQVARHL